MRAAACIATVLAQCLSGAARAQKFAGDGMALTNCLNAASELSAISLTMLNGDADAATETPGDLVFGLRQRLPGLTPYREPALEAVFRGDPSRIEAALDMAEACIAARGRRASPVVPVLIDLSSELQGICLATYEGK